MANRNFNRKQALEHEVKEIYAEIAIGASGAPTLSRGTGVASISRTSAGLYVLTLADKYVRLMQCVPAVVTPAAEQIAVHMATNTINAGGKTVTIRTTASGVATDPANGDTLFVKLELKNSSAR